MPPYTVHALHASPYDRTAVPYDGNVRMGHVVVTLVCTIFVHRLHYVDYSHIISSYFLTIFLETEYIRDVSNPFDDFDQRRRHIN